jgi:hypothetical protein
MANDVRVVLNHANIAKLLKSAGVAADLEERANRIAAAAGDGMEVTTLTGRTRARASVRTATFKAREAEATNRALTNALDAGR